jgi:hypothetical protein
MGKENNMPRIIINVPTSIYSRDTARYVLPEMTDDQANQLIAVLARAQRVDRTNVGTDGVLVIDPIGVISTEITDSSAILSKKQLAEAQAAHEESQARKQAENAAKARRAAELVEA